MKNGRRCRPTECKNVPGSCCINVGCIRFEALNGDLASDGVLTLSEALVEFTSNYSLFIPDQKVGYYRLCEG